MTTVVHFNAVKHRWNWRLQRWDHPDEIVYCGRRNKEYHLPPSPWANPIRLHSDSAEARAEAINQYRTWITTSDDGQALLANLPQLRGRILVCWCKPLPCHCDVLLELLGEKDHVEVERPAQVDLDGRAPQDEAILLWDAGMAMYHIGMNKSGVLYRDTEKMQHVLGTPRKVYTEWMDWYRDFLKDTLRIRPNTPMTPHARYCYERRLQNLIGHDDQRSTMERAILAELIAELEGDING